MPSMPEVINVEELLEPISEESPAGEGQQYTGLYDDIREARRADDTLDKGDWVREEKVADWAQVERLGCEALRTKTKDLQIGAWLVEALVKRHGYAGLREGLRLMHGLHERFWETLYPEVDDGDLEARANALAWMDKQAASAIREAPLTRSATGSRYNYIQFEESIKYDVPENYDDLDYSTRVKYDQLKQEAQAEGRVTSEMWRAAKASSPRAYYEELWGTIEDCWAWFKSLDQIMDEKFGRETPGLGELKKTLETIRNPVERIVKEKRQLEPDPVEAQAEAEGVAEGAEGAVGAGYAGGRAGTGPIRNRQEALVRLSEIAQYFRTYEPHSPVSYLVQRAVRWGNMPLDVWLKEVIKNDGVLEELRDTLGVQGTEEGGGGY